MLTPIPKLWGSSPSWSHRNSFLFPVSLGVRGCGFSSAQGQTWSSWSPLASLPRCLTSHSLWGCRHLGEPALRTLRTSSPPRPPSAGEGCVCTLRSMYRMGCGVRKENHPISKSMSKVCHELNSPYFSSWPQPLLKSQTGPLRLNWRKGKVDIFQFSLSVSYPLYLSSHGRTNIDWTL